MSEPFGTPIKTAGRSMVYLDWSIVIDLAEKRLRPLWNALRDGQSRGLVVPYSLAHLVDSGATDAAITPDQRALIDNRLAFLSDLTRDHLLFVGGNPTAVHLFRQSPQRFQRGARVLAPSFQAIKDDIIQYPREYFKKAREALNLEPNRTNNIKPPHVIRQLDDLVAKAWATRRPEIKPPSVRLCLEETSASFPGGLGLADKVALCISNLTFLGYFPDREGVGDRAWNSATDGAHASFAIATSAFGTSDKALRLKALAAYEFLDIRIPVLTATEFLDFANTNFA